MVEAVTSHSGKTCPHGFPIGACPICGGGGGGMRRTQKYSNPKQTMSYSEMVAIWHRMQAAQARKEDEKINAQRMAEKLQNVKQTLSNMMNKLGSVLSKIQSFLPQLINNLFSNIANKVLAPIMNMVQNFPEAVKNFGEFLQNIKAQLFVAAEKLASVFGEIKNFIQKSVSESFKRFTKKAYKLLNLFGLGTEDDFNEDERVNAEIYAFKVKDIKTLKEILFRLINRRSEQEDAKLPQ